MSTDFVTDKPISFDELKMFNHLGVKFDSKDERTIILTDGDNYMYADNNPEFDPFISGDKDLHIRYIGVHFTAQAGNDFTKIVAAIEDFFSVNLVSEYNEKHDQIILDSSEPL